MCWLCAPYVLAGTIACLTAGTSQAVDSQSLMKPAFGLAVLGLHSKGRGCTAERRARASVTIDTLAAHDYLRFMARRLRIQYPGAIYHVMNRGDQREAIFRDDDDRRQLLLTLGEACRKTEWQVHAYCLMSNHVHLVVETPQPNLVDGMKWLLGVHTKRFNIRHELCGHLFAGRYKALIVEGSGNGYLRTVCDYVHLNPVRAGLAQTSHGGKPQV
jgi:REP element-mobilizing transposase RayT